MKTNYRWTLGFLGFLCLQGIPYFKSGDWSDALWFLWAIWFLYFIPQRKSDS